jgi:large subunit ribosomal protein L10
MKRKDKDIIIEKLTQEIKGANHFYLTDLSDLNAADTSALRRLCFSKNIKLLVVKNTLLQKALERIENSDFAELTGVLNGHTSVMFSEQANVPAKLIKEFRKKHKKPLLKAAYAEQSIYIGDDQINALDQIKSKNELIADVIALLQSPIRNVMSGLQSGGQKISGILETLSKREN